jgi:uncharacterized membrane protein YhaH (DUF805 family)
MPAQRYGSGVSAEETHDERVNRELIELLNELRLALPGVLVLFGFLLAVPFASRFEAVTRIEKGAYMVSLLASVAGSILLMAPTALHRLRWRDVDKEELLRLSNSLAIAGTVFLASAMTSAVFLVTEVLLGTWATIVVTGFTGTAFLFGWYLLPLRVPSKEEMGRGP